MGRGAGDEWLAERRAGAAERAGAEQQGFALALLDAQDAADEDDVVAGDDLLLLAALEVRDGVGQQRAAAQPFGMVEPGKLVRGRAGEMAAEVVMPGGRAR